MTDLESSGSAPLDSESPRYWCLSRACCSTFLDAESAIQHADETGHNCTHRNPALRSGSASPPDWRCNKKRSHGFCNTLNGSEESSCGACGEDRPPGSASQRTPSTCGHSAQAYADISYVIPAPVAASSPEPEKCIRCGMAIEEGARTTFTVCDDCWKRSRSAALGASIPEPAPAEEHFEALVEAYDRLAPRQVEGPVPFFSVATMSDADLNVWDFEDRFLARRVAKALVALRASASSESRMSESDERYLATCLAEAPEMAERWHINAFAREIERLRAALSLSRSPTEQVSENSQQSPG